jgi:hypothetical protein
MRAWSDTRIENFRSTSTCCQESKCCNQSHTTGYCVSHDCVLFLWSREKLCSKVFKFVQQIEIIWVHISLQQPVLAPAITAGRLLFCSFSMPAASIQHICCFSFAVHRCLTTKFCYKKTEKKSRGKTAKWPTCAVQITVQIFTQFWAQANCTVKLKVYGPLGYDRLNPLSWLASNILKLVCS